MFIFTCIIYIERLTCISMCYFFLKLLCGTIKIIHKVESFNCEEKNNKVEIT